MKKNFTTSCQSCKKPFTFETKDVYIDTLTCPHCKEKMKSKDFLDHLQKFVTLHSTLETCADILPTTVVGIDVGSQKVQIPLTILLTHPKLTVSLDSTTEKLSIFLQPLQK